MDRKATGNCKKLYKNTGCSFICFSSFSAALAGLLGHLEVLGISRMPSSSKHQDYGVAKKGWLRKPCWCSQWGCNNQEKVLINILTGFWNVIINTMPVAPQHYQRPLFFPTLCQNFSALQLGSVLISASAFK